MNVALGYGDDKIVLELPEGAVLDEISCKVSTTTVGYDIFKEKLAAAEKEIFRAVEADLFIVNDAYRPTPTETILDWIIKSGGICGTAAFLVSTGTHPVPSTGQLRTIFGRHYHDFKGRIFGHDCKDRAEMVRVGEDHSGNVVYLNRKVVEAEKIVVIGSVEPHYFAGFTGGRKSIFPGLCDFDTTARNHNLAVGFEASPMKLEGNPVEESLQELMKLVEGKDILSIQAVLGKRGEMTSIHCGDIVISFEDACEESREIYSGAYNEQYDMLLAEVRPPLDANLYQLQKSLENCQGAVKDGGAMILFSPCHEGIGTRNFYDLAERWKRGEVRIGDGPESFGMHKLARVEQISQRINVYLHSELDEGVPDRVYYMSLKKPRELIDKISQNDSNISIALVHDAGHTVLTKRLN